jgi:hypothetical protein
MPLVHGGGDAVMIERPLGMVTFLFTDIEASTRRWEEKPEEMRVALTRHDVVLREAIANCGGWLVKHTGDGVIAAFASARSAVDAAIVAQRRLDRASSTVKAEISTIAPRFRINRRDDESDRCSASGQRVMPSAFFPLTNGSITTSSFAAITSVPTNIVRLATPPFAHGATSAKLRLQHGLQNRLFGH